MGRPASACRTGTRAGMRIARVPHRRARRHQPGERPRVPRSTAVPQSTLDYHEMLARENLDIVSICTWPHLHAPMVIAAAEAGVRAIHCEKPMAPTWGEARRMVRSVRTPRRATDLQPPAPLPGAVPPGARTAARRRDRRPAAAGDALRLTCSTGARTGSTCATSTTTRRPPSGCWARWTCATGGRSWASHSKGRV